MKKTYTIPQVPGTRRVSPLTYTHAIIGRSDGALAASHMRDTRAVNQARIDAWDRKVWEADKRLSDAELGQPFRAINGYKVQPTQKGIDAARVFIAKHPTSDDYLRSEAAQHELDVKAAEARGTDPVLQVLQWNQSFENATKAMPGFQRLHSDVQVVATVMT